MADRECRNAGRAPWFFRRHKLNQRMSIAAACITAGFFGHLIGTPESICSAVITGGFAILATDAVVYTGSAVFEDLKKE